MEISLEQRIHVAALEIAEGNGIDREAAREMLDDQGSILQGDCQIYLDTSCIEDIATGEMI